MAGGFALQWHQFSHNLFWITYCQRRFLWPLALSGYPIWIPAFEDEAFALCGKTPEQIQILPWSTKPLPSGTIPLKTKMLTGLSSRVLQWDSSYLSWRWNAKGKKCKLLVHLEICFVFGKWSVSISQSVFILTHHKVTFRSANKAGFVIRLYSQCLNREEIRLTRVKTMHQQPG